MRNLSVVLILIVILSLNTYGQVEIDTTLKVDEWMESMMPNVTNESIYYPVVKRDQSDNVIEKNFMQRWNGKNANWRIHFIYNTDNLLIKEWNTDTLNNIVKAVVCGAPMTKYKYDENGQLTEIAFFSNDDSPTIHDCSHFHKKIVEYDQKGRVVFNQFVGLENKIQDTQSFKLDSKDRIVEVNLLESNRELIKDSPSIIIVKYDNQDREIENRYLNWDRSPINEDDKLSYETYEYEEDAQIITYYNSKGVVLRKIKQSSNGAVSVLTDVKN